MSWKLPLHRKEAVRHLGYARRYGCGWAWRGRFICRVCYSPRLPEVLARLNAGLVRPGEEPTT